VVTSPASLKLVAPVSRAVEFDDVRLVELVARVLQVPQKPSAGTLALRITSQAKYAELPEGRGVEVRARFEVRALPDQENAKPVVRVRATFALAYRFTEEARFSQKELSAFAKVNGIYNAWPYWRELVQSTFARMGFPQLVVPVYRIPRMKSTERKVSSAPRKQEDPVTAEKVQG
jgi:preprotein translocase subunit SecB